MRLSKIFAGFLIGMSVLIHLPFGQTLPDYHMSGDWPLYLNELPATFKTAHNYTELYIDVAPNKYYTIQGQPQKYEITLKIKVLIEDTINSIDLNIWLTSESGTPIHETNLLTINPCKPSQTTFNGISYTGDGWYNLSFDHQTGYYSTGDTIKVEFYIIDPSEVSWPPIAILRLINNEDLPNQQTLFPVGGYMGVNNAGICLMVKTIPEENFAYPDQTPRTIVTPDGTVRLTLNVSPKKRGVPLNTVQSWDVEIKAEILKDTDWIWLWSELYGWYSAYEVEFDYKFEYETETPIMRVDEGLGNRGSGEEFWTTRSTTYSFFIAGAFAEEGHYFVKGDTFHVKGVLTYPNDRLDMPHAQVNNLLIIVGDHASSSQNYEEAIIGCFFNVGPQFVIPELPIGTLTALASMGLALMSRRLRK